MKINYEENGFVYIVFESKSLTALDGSKIFILIRNRYVSKK